MPSRSNPKVVRGKVKAVVTSEGRVTWVVPVLYENFCPKIGDKIHCSYKWVNVVLSCVKVFQSCCEYFHHFFFIKEFFAVVLENSFYWHYHSIIWLFCSAIKSIGMSLPSSTACFLALALVMSRLDWLQFHSAWTSNISRIEVADSSKSAFSMLTI